MVLYKYVYYNFFDPGTQFPGNEKITLCNTKKVIIIIIITCDVWLLFYHSDCQALSTARCRLVSPLVTADTCLETLCTGMQCGVYAGLPCGRCCLSVHTAWSFCCHICSYVIQREYQSYFRFSLYSCSCHNYLALSSDTRIILAATKNASFQRPSTAPTLHKTPSAPIHLIHVTKGAV